MPPKSAARASRLVDSRTTGPLVRTYRATLGRDRAQVHVTLPARPSRAQLAHAAAELRALAASWAREADEDAAWEEAARAELLASSATIGAAAEQARTRAEDAMAGSAADAIDECLRVLAALDEWRKGAVLYLEAAAGTTSPRE